MTLAWTIFGVGNFIYDIIDAIGSNGDALTQVILNQPTSLNLPNYIKQVDFKRYKTHKPFGPEYGMKYFFGFINPEKEKFLEILSKKGITQFGNIIHQQAYIGLDAELGQGNFIGAGAIIGPKAKLGNFNYVNRKASVGHETQIGSFNHLGPNATVCGRCLIGDKNFLGASSTVNDNLTLKDKITVGSGGVVTKNIEIPGTYVGIPAKILN